MYGGCIVCCPLVSHIELVPHSILMLEKQLVRQMDRQIDALRIALDMDSIKLSSVKMWRSWEACK